VQVAYSENSLCFETEIWFFSLILRLFFWGTGFAKLPYAIVWDVFEPVKQL